MAPITRRRKRVIDSDDEGDDVTDTSHFADTSMLKTRSATSTSGLSKNGSRLNKKSITDSSWSSNPSHSHVQKKPKVEDKSLSGDLVSIFSRQAQNQKASQAAKISLAQRPRNIPSADDITDLISDDDDGINATSASLVGQRAQKRFQATTGAKSTRTSIPTPTPSLVSSQSSQLFPASGSKPRNMFLRPSAPGVVAKKADHDDIRPWSEQFGPTTLDELAVHKKKVSDVRRWLSDVLGGLTRQRILLLKGAAGTGKTTTVKLLAQSLGFEILEWKNPTGGLFGSTLSASRQFESFIGVGGTFGTLDTDASEVMPSKLDAFNYDDKTRRIILIEEFPNTYTRSSTVLASFRNALVEFLTSNVPTLAMFANKRVKQPIVPIVMIVSETLLTTTSASADSFTAHRLLGPDILRHPGATVIEFNAIAPSILTKALELVVLKEARKSGRKRTPGPLVLKRLGEIGDIRSAISSLEFLCLKGDQDGDWGSRVLFSKPKKAMRNVSLTRAEEATLEQISQRESSLGIFHAVAKVVYNKREEDGLHDNPAERLPPFLARHSRPKASLVNVETLIDEIGTDTSTFVSALHENYPLSCEQTSYSEDLPTSIDHVNACIDALSDSDLLCPSWDVFFGGRGSYLGLSNRDTGSYILRQDEMAFQVAVRGLLHGLPCPVKRQQHPSRGSSDAFKMFYPTSIKLWRTREEIEGLLDDWSSKLLQSDKYMSQHNVTAGADIFRRGNAGIPRKTVPSEDQQSKSPHSGEPAPLLSLGNAGRKEMVLERLPTMAAILRGKKNNPAHSVSMSALRLKDIEKVVSFYGISGQLEEVLGEGDEDLGVEDAGEQWATDKPTDEVLPRKKRTAIKQKDSATKLEAENMPLVEKLVLSDDDIED